LKRIIACLLAAALLMLALAGCSSGDSNPARANDNAPTPDLPVNDGGLAIVARVNNQDITLPEYERAFERRQLNSNVADLNALSANVLDTLIEQALIDQAAARMGISISDVEVNEEYALLRTAQPDEAQWQAWLDANLYTDAEYRESLRTAMLTTRVRDAVTGSETEIVPEVHARHILVDTEAEALDVLAQIEQGGDFATLALAHSNDVTTFEAGGDLGWFIAEELIWTPELSEAAMTMQPGEVRGPIVTMLGYHIIQVLEVGQREVLLDESPEVAQARFEEWLTGIIDGATVERFLN
jgi:parvulin-like peptidyl-prolyl isomerase